ncbi:MAG: hypothetical protein A2603_07120 [Bdellovibrionales bacterium RIFOXYD1_FULL_55_31]|nr:MAG: hypothetical protein A2603_07120 [Bdellovibrionales bacterium RIFOXYD1_FULL_55_31]
MRFNTLCLSLFLASILSWFSSVHAATVTHFAVVAGGKAFTDSAGIAYRADANFVGGRTASRTVAISGTIDDYLYRNERYGNFYYKIPIPNGTYNIVLKFAETYWAAPGRRVFHVNINGVRAISNLDIFAKVGRNAAYDVVLPVTVTNGAIRIDFVTVIYNAKVSALRVESISAKANQNITITTPAPGSSNYDGRFTVAASASSGLPVSYSSGNLSVCTNVGATFTVIAGSGTCIVQYNQVGSIDYNAAPQVTNNVTVSKATQTIGAISFSPAPIGFGATSVASATASSGLAVTYSALTPSVCGVNSATGGVSALRAGTCIIAAHQDGNAYFDAATQVSGSLSINPTLPSAPTGVIAAAGDSQATVRFSPPLSDGGAAVTLYVVTASPGGATGSGAVSPVVVSGLSNGTAYTFMVTAVNAAGTGPSSVASNSVTPVYSDGVAPLIGELTLPSTFASQLVPVSSFSATDNVGVTGYCITTTDSSSDCHWTETAPTTIAFPGTGLQTAFAWAKDAVGNLSLSKSAVVQVSASQSVIGNIEAVVTNANGTISVQGWACETLNPNPIDIHFYLGGGYPEGTMVAYTAADQVSEDLISWFCNSSGTAYRFNYALPRSLRAQFANQKIYIHGISPTGQGNPIILNSGTFQVPPMSQTPVISQFSVPTSSRELTLPWLTLSATGDQGVSAYTITESPMAPAASDPRWTPTVPSTYTFSAPGGKTLYAWAKDAAGNVSAGKAVEVAVTPIGGNFENVKANADGSFSLNGWACSYGSALPIQLAVYFGGPYPQGTMASSMISANQPSEDGVAQACGSTGTAYRFYHTFPQSVRAQFSSQKIYIHGIDPKGGVNPLISGSGEFNVPFDPSSTPPDEIRIARTGHHMVGTYIYPGWSKASTGWQIQQWPGLEQAVPFAPPGADQPRVPFMNYNAYNGRYYDDSDPRAVDWMIKWSLESGVSFFIYDWFWAGQKDSSGNYKPYWEKNPLEEAFLKSKYLSKYPDDIHFGLLWVTDAPWCYYFVSSCPVPGDPTFATMQSQIRDFNDQAMDYMIKNYFNRSQHLKIDDKPVLLIWDIRKLKLGTPDNPDGSNSELTSTISRWQQKVINANPSMKGLYILAGPGDPAMVHAGVLGMNSYSYVWTALETARGNMIGLQAPSTKIVASGMKRWAPDGSLESDPQVGYAMSYNDLTRVYEWEWNNHLNTAGNLNISYLPIVTPGMDDTPWWCRGEVRSDITALPSSCNDRVMVIPPSSPGEYKQSFKNQLSLVKSLTETRSFTLGATINGVNKKLILNEAWDEWGEGAVLAPTERFGFAGLNAIQEVFKSSAQRVVMVGNSVGQMAAPAVAASLGVPAQTVTTVAWEQSLGTAAQCSTADSFDYASLNVKLQSDDVLVVELGEDVACVPLNFEARFENLIRKIVGDKFAVPVFVVVSPWWDTQITEQMKNVASRNGYHWLELPEHGTDYNVDNSAALRALPNEKGVKLIADSIVSEFRKAGLQVGN